MWLSSLVVGVCLALVPAAVAPAGAVPDRGEFVPGHATAVNAHSRPGQPGSGTGPQGSVDHSRM